MPPTTLPLPRFVAEPPHEQEPHGRWRMTLEQLFDEACGSIEGETEIKRKGAITWFPDRTYGIRVFVPARAATAEGAELFGFVSFTRADGSSEPADFFARADYAAEVPSEHPGWKLDLNDEVIAPWKGLAGAHGDLTLVWGTPLVPGGATATAEISDQTLDQCALDSQGRFTLVALDAIAGFGDELYLELKLWDKKGGLLASETLYEVDEEAG